MADLFVSQANARIHLVAFFVVTAAGFYFQISRMEWALVLLCSGLVLALEAVNTALEYLTDLVSPGRHPLAGKAKDAAAAAVLFAAIMSVLIGFLIFFPKVSAWYQS